MDHIELRRLLQSHHTSAFGWAVFCCDGNRDEAEDLLQTVYVRLLDKNSKSLFKGDSSFQTWLFAVIRNLAMKRRHRLARQLEKLKKFFVSEANPPEQEDRVVREQAKQRILELLALLSERQREALHLVFYQDLSVEEAAGVMGIAVGSARTHYERGKARLRHHMMQTGFSHEFKERRFSNQEAI